MEPKITSKTKVIQKSEPYGMPPIVVHHLMDETTKKKLRKIFLSLHSDPKGQNILNNLQIDRFIPGNDEDYTTVREMQNFLNDKKQ